MAQHHRDEDAFMVPGMGAQPMPPAKYNPANDNEAKRSFEDTFSAEPLVIGMMPQRGQYIGLTRPGDSNGCADDLVVASVMSSPLNVMPTGREIPVAAMPHAGGYVETGTAARHHAYDPQPLRPLGEHIVTPRPAWPARHGDWLQTYTGKQFWPLDPRSHEVDIRDIAHALSMQCRYAGHCRRFYSVAEHSVLIARWLVGKNKPAAIYGLLHDASEAYLVDVPRPVKPFLTGYAAAEARVQSVIWARFDLAPTVPAIVKEADDRILADELVNMTRMSWHARHADPLGVPMMYWSPAEAEEEFLATYAALTGEVA